MRLIVLPVLLLLAACDKQSTPDPQGEANTADRSAKAPSLGKADYSHKGEAPPADSFETADGKTTSIAAFKGKPVLVNLWATWCAPCLKELPSIDALAKREAKTLTVLAISQDMKGREAVDPWWNKQGFSTLKPALDSKADLSFAYGGGSLPMTILYDRAGREVWRVIGDLDWASDDAKALIEQAG